MRRLMLTALPIASLAFAGVTVATLAPAGVARAQMISSREGIALENQILELKQEMQSGQQGNGNSALAAPAPESSGGGAASSSALLPNMLQQIQTLTDQVQNLRGRVDTLEHEVATQHDELKQEIGNLKFQLSQNGATAAPGQGTAAPPPAPTPVPAAARTPRVEASITAARRALAGGDYKAAAADSRAVIAHQGKNAAKGAAELTLAQALDHQGDHQGAAIAYDDAYNANRAGPNAPDALLGLAGSLTAIHQNQEACDTLDSLASQFSSPSHSLATRIHLARVRAHCG
jgi:TolA-binding protein